MATFIDLDSVWRERQTYPNPCDYQLLPSQIASWPRAGRDVNSLPKNPNERPHDFVTSINMLTVTLPYPRIELYAKSSVIIDSILANVVTTVDPHGLVDGDIIMTSAAFYRHYGLDRNVEYHVINSTPTTFQLSLTPAGAAITLTNGTGINLVAAVISAADYAEVIAANNVARQLVDFPRLYIDFRSKLYNDTRCLRTINGNLPDAKFVLGIDRIQINDVGMPIWLHYKVTPEQVIRFKRDDCMIVRIMTRDGTTIPFFTEPDLMVPTNPLKQTLLTVEVTPYDRDASFTNHSVDPLM